MGLRWFVLGPLAYCLIGNRMCSQRLGDFAFGEMKIKSKENVCTLQKSAFLVAFDALNRRSCLISAMLSRIHQAKDCGGYD
jgi:hypothetical protein